MLQRIDQSGHYLIGDSPDAAQGLGGTGADKPLLVVVQRIDQSRYPRSCSRADLPDRNGRTLADNCVLVLHPIYESGYCRWAEVPQRSGGIRPPVCVVVVQRIGQSWYGAFRGWADFSQDTACCMRIARSGDARSWGSPGDGLDSVDTDTEMYNVLNVSIARVKVVRDINWCGGAGTNIIGCAPVPGDSMVVVRFSNFGVESVLWMHEYGHNAGLVHNSDSRYIMAAQASSMTARGMRSS